MLAAAVVGAAVASPTWAASSAALVAAVALAVAGGGMAVAGITDKASSMILPNLRCLFAATPLASPRS